MNSILEAALKLAAQGVKVLPLHSIRPDGICSCGGHERYSKCKPGKHPYGKHVPHGVSDATDDPDIIQSWFSAGSLNLGIATGSTSGLFALDQDDRDGGHLSVEDKEEQFGALPKTLVQRTGNGKHFLFKIPAGVDVRNSQKFIAPGIDIRGTGGYIVAAPSIHESGRQYEFIGVSEFDRSLIADAPDWLIEMVAEKPKTTRMGISEYDDLASHASAFRIPNQIRDGEGRESFLLRYAGHLRAKGIDQPEIESTLLAFNQERIIPSLDEEIVLDRARRFEGEQATGSTAISNVSPIEPTPGDIENGRMFAARYRGKFKYVYSAKKWLGWDSQRWAWCEAGEALAAAKEIADMLLDHSTEAFKANPIDPNVKRMMAHAMKTRDERRLHSMLALAQSEPDMGIANLGLLDTDPWLLNVQNGVVDLRTGLLLAHDPKMLHTKICNTYYRQEANCPQWKKFLTEIFCNDADLIAYIKRALGYSLTGLVTEEVMFFMFGFGANGKSVFINTIILILADYAMTAPASMLALKRNDDKGRASPEMARMVGARFAVANETQSSDRLDEQLVKILVSRERIAARPLYGDYFEFLPTHALWVRGNHKPIVTGDDHGIWRRIQLIPFMRTFSQEEIDPHLEEKLAGEADGILTWLVEGCLEWQQHGLNPPTAVLNASNQYRKESDVLGQWIEDECDTDPSFRCLERTVYGAYSNWCSQNGLRPMTKAMFTRKLLERGCAQAWINRDRAYVGISLRNRLSMSNAA